VADLELDVTQSSDRVGFGSPSSSSSSVFFTDNLPTRRISNVARTSGGDPGMGLQTEAGTSLRHRLLVDYGGWESRQLLKIIGYSKWSSRKWTWKRIRLTHYNFEVPLSCRKIYQPLIMYLD